MFAVLVTNDENDHRIKTPIQSLKVKNKVVALSRRSNNNAVTPARSHQTEKPINEHNNSISGTYNNEGLQIPKHLEESARNLWQTITLDPENSKHWWSWLQFLHRKCQPDRLLVECDQAKQQIHTKYKTTDEYAKILLLQCKYLSKCQQRKKAISVYETMFHEQIGRNSYYYWINYASILHKTRSEHSKAIDILTHALESNIPFSIEERSKIQTQLHQYQRENNNLVNVVQSFSFSPTPTVNQAQNSTKNDHHVIGQNYDENDVDENVSANQNHDSLENITITTPTLPSFDSSVFSRKWEENEEENENSHTPLTSGHHNLANASTNMNGGATTTGGIPGANKSRFRTRLSHFPAFVHTSGPERVPLPSSPVSNSSNQFTEQSNDTFLHINNNNIAVKNHPDMLSPACRPIPLIRLSPRIEPHKQTTITTPETTQTATRISKTVRFPDQSPVPSSTNQQFISPHSTNTTRRKIAHLKFPEIVVHGRQYAVLSVLGTGGSCRVYKAVGNHNIVNGKRKTEFFAIKQVNLVDHDEVICDGFRSEIELLQSLQGETRIVNLFDFEITQKKLLLVLELGEADLRQLLSQLRTNNASSGPGGRNSFINYIRLYWQQMLEAVQVIHNKRIVHRDLKPANFVSFKGTLKLIDFGIAGAIQANTMNLERSSVTGTVDYIAPEACQSLMDSECKYKMGVASDIWSLGVILYEMLYHTTPFASANNVFVKIQQIVNSDITYPANPTSNPFIIPVIQMCLQKDPCARASIEDLLSHPFLQ